MMPADVWRDLTKMAMRLINDLEDERAPIDVTAVVDATLEAYGHVPDAQKARARLEAFVRDMIRGSPRGSA